MLHYIGLFIYAGPLSCILGCNKHVPCICCTIALYGVCKKIMFAGDKHVAMPKNMQYNTNISLGKFIEITQKLTCKSYRLHSLLGTQVFMAVSGLPLPSIS